MLNKMIDETEGRALVEAHKNARLPELAMAIVRAVQSRDSERASELVEGLLNDTEDLMPDHERGKLALELRRLAQAQ
jgi:hypothetical protein